MIKNILLVVLLGFAVSAIPVENQKDLLSSALQLFGLDQVWSTVQALGTSTVAQLTAIVTQLLFAGSQLWEQAKLVFAQLVSDLTNHASDAVPLVSQAIAQLNQLLAQSGK
ncbi:unnamed protein product [Brachionus calyciflorus]|uniref:Uncharacterized protein n=1 Tax=Brachionus calyciflorus TaxID=104777 RepID=A0A813ZRU0_9BILA|nr:unnamed protein product [Brachionus calyciflorus]